MEGRLTGIPFRGNRSMPSVSAQDHPRTIYACSVPLSSELKNPEHPSGARKGWIWVSFRQEDPGLATFLAFDNRAIIPSRKIEKPDRAAPVPWARIRNQAAAGDVRGEVVEVRSFEGSGTGRFAILRASHCRNGPRAPPLGRRVSWLSSGSRVDVLVIATSDRPIQHWCPGQNSFPSLPHGKSLSEVPSSRIRWISAPRPPVSFSMLPSGDATFAVVLLDHDVVRGFGIGLPRVLRVDVAPGGTAKDHPHGWRVYFKNEQSPGGVFGSAVAQESGDRDSPALG